jgi:hypothetical protein
VRPFSVAARRGQRGGAGSLDVDGVPDPDVPLAFVRLGLSVTVTHPANVRIRIARKAFAVFVRSG